MEHDDELDGAFKALADPTRRFLLDLLFVRDGRTLTELESELSMTRFGVMKHLKVLEAANLVVSRRSGREKLHYLNPVPIRMMHDRWIDKYTRARRQRARRPQEPTGEIIMSTTDTIGSATTASTAARASRLRSRCHACTSRRPPERSGPH